MPAHKLYQLALTLTPRIGHTTLKSLISYCGSAQAVFDTPKGKLLKVPGVGPQAAQSILQPAKALKKAEEILEYTQKNEVNLYFYTDTDYPDYLKQIFDAPALLYGKGNNYPKGRYSISIVGTRNATAEGKQNVQSIIKALAPYNPVIVSGLAYGIDVEAHKAALECKLPTFAVMATGIEKVYPELHTKIAHKMLEHGGLFTEYQPFSKMDPGRFPARNRIIAGLTQATLVVEAGKKGGALITAYLARDYNREVFAVPGNLKNEFSVGCNHIIKTNVAQLISGGEDIAYFLGWETDRKPATAMPVTGISQNEVSAEEWKLIELMQGKELHIDELSWRSQMPVSKLAALLLGLEFKNVVVALPGKKYALK